MTFDFNNYAMVCLATADRDDLFVDFRRQHTFYDMYEHASYEQGLVYLEEIRKVPEVFNNIDRFLKNDQVGQPRVYMYEDIDRSVAPTTLRYIKVLADLVTHFGSLDDMNIVEVGGGYGGQCRIIHEMFRVKSYTLVDLPEVIPLAQKYLKQFDIVISGNNGPYDLFISNYAFTEVIRAYQDVYVQNFVKRSLRGYVTCNFYPWNETDGMLTFGELVDMVPDSKVHEEKPLTAKDNFILTWNLLPR